MKWFAVHVGFGKEGAVDTGLRRQGFVTFYPFERRRRRRKRPGGKLWVVEWVERPYFPNYLFVALRRAGGTIGAILRTHGVYHVVGNAAGPIEVPHAAMNDLMGRVGPEGLVGEVDEVSRKLYKPGQRLWFLDGSPFAGFVATVSADRGASIRLFIETVQGRCAVVAPPGLVAAG